MNEAVRSACVAIVVGGAECVWDDLFKADALIAEAGAEPTYFVINDMIAAFDRPCVALTLHLSNLGKWLECRQATGFPKPSAVWAHRSPSAREPGYGLATKFTDDLPGHGSSGLFACKIAREVKFERIVLCGVPMSPEAGHFVRHLAWDRCEQFQAAWRIHQRSYAPFVRSMGGWTAEMFGRPSLAFLGAADKGNPS